jgi:hypothetical protein
MKRITKYILSFFKDEWNLTDYPVDFKQHNQQSEKMWKASISGWDSMSGIGKTHESAAAILEEKFQDYKEKYSSLPRPGTRGPDIIKSLVIAPQTKISLYEDVARDFIERIIGFAYDSVFITDMSSLWDFKSIWHEDNEAIYSRIEEVYGVDIRDIEDGNLVRIFERLCSSSN